MNKSRNFDPITDKLTAYFRNDPTIISAYIFGSFGTDRQTPMSDLDIGVLFDGGIPIMQELKLTAEISSILMIEKVDLINLSKAPVHFQHEILSNGTKIYDQMPERTQDFIEGMLEIYHDYQGILKKYRDDFREGLLEEYFNGR